jgi:hypothetical protein
MGSIMWSVKVLIGTDWNDSGRINVIVSDVIVAFDVIEIYRA